MTAAELREQVAGRQWYHTLELAPGVRTPGWFDLRETAAALLPASLAGRRCLDVGTFDGFWAFEMERRGAAEVIAIDILDPRRWDWPANSADEVVAALGERKRGGAGFELAREALGSAVERRELSVYDLDPDEIGSFDFVYVGSLLLHLRDPVRALAAVALGLPRRGRDRGRDRPAQDAASTGASRWPPSTVAAGPGGGSPTSPASRASPRRPGSSSPSRRGGCSCRSGRATRAGCGPRACCSRRPAARSSLNSWRGDPHGVLAARPGAG